MMAHDAPNGNVRTEASIDACHLLWFVNIPQFTVDWAADVECDIALPNLRGNFIISSDIMGEINKEMKGNIQEVGLAARNSGCVYVTDFDWSGLKS